MKDQSDYINELDEIKAFNGWNDAELAKQMNVASSMISNWRTGKVQMTAKSKKKILDFFQSLAIQKKLPNQNNDSGMFSQLKKIWDILSVSDQARVITYASELLEKSGHEPFDCDMASNRKAN